ncbi:MAG TPA: uracil-DNA glycosylase [Candidatus Ozemobacteraceae bacterium]|nr:uracil-DNA glycosylase [Candidatus Ozemobacteraceae bacterium]
MTPHPGNSTPASPPRKPGIDCHSCVHYFVTWEPAAPHGCRGHGFKSRQLPAIVVQASSGMACLLYTPKRPPRR